MSSHVLSNLAMSNSTLADLLATRALAMGGKQAFRFIPGHGGQQQVLTYRALHERAMALAGEMQAMAAPGERVLLLFPPGLDFVAAFFGCLYAGIVAVPVAPPTRNRLSSSIEAIFHASKPAIILSTAAHRRLAEQAYAHLSRVLDRPWVATDHVADNRRQLWRRPQIDGDQPAFLQYTSGSTATPKGVVLSHANLLHNSALIQQAFGNTSEGTGVSWLPLASRHGPDRRHRAADLLRRARARSWPRRPSCSGRPCGWRRFRRPARR